MADQSLFWDPVGKAKVLAAMAAAGPHALVDGGAALFREAETVMRMSRELVPIDQGVLRASGYVERPTVEHGTVTVTAGYGGAAKDYAVVQHEDLTLRHSPGKYAKYLERPLLYFADGMADRVADFMRARREGRG